MLYTSSLKVILHLKLNITMKVLFKLKCCTGILIMFAF